jgi:hypothetical protein
VADFEIGVDALLVEIDELDGRADLRVDGELAPVDGVKLGGEVGDPRSST